MQKVIFPCSFIYAKSHNFYSICHNWMKKKRRGVLFFSPLRCSEKILITQISIVYSIKLKFFNGKFDRKSLIIKTKTKIFFRIFNAKKGGGGAAVDFLID